MLKASIVIPVRNDPERLQKLLGSLSPDDWQRHEVLVVTDHSTDQTSEVAARFPARVVAADDNCWGPAAARNLGARLARESVIVFLDSDVVLEPDAIARMLRRLEDPKAAGVTTLASERPENPGFVPRYCAINERALLSRWASAHNGGEQDQTWYLSTRCGAIRKEVFEAVGGFDPGFEAPSVEDTEFSFRLSRRFRMVLELSVGYKHHWPPTVGNWLSRVFRNARMLMRLSFEGKMTSGTVLPLGEQIGRVAAGLAVLLLIPAAVWLPAAFAALACFAISLFVHRDLFRIFEQREGLSFAIRGMGLHYLGTLAGLLGGVAALFGAPRDALRSMIGAHG